MARYISSEIRDEEYAALKTLRDCQKVLPLRGTWREVLQNHRHHCAIARANGGNVLKALVAQLHHRASDARLLYFLLDHRIRRKKMYPDTIDAISDADRSWCQTGAANIQFQMRHRPKYSNCVEYERHTTPPSVEYVKYQATYLILEPLLIPWTSQPNQRSRAHGLAEIRNVSETKQRTVCPLRGRQYIW